MKATAAEWTERVRAWRESGLPALQFAEGKGFSGKMLQWWGSELGRRARQKPGVKLARVRVRAASVPVVLAVGAARIEVRPGFDGALLREVVAVLGTVR